MFEAYPLKFPAAMTFKQFRTMSKYRSAKTGEYVKPGYAKTHPATTVKESDKKPKK
ncbi:hypothetical protein SAMN05660236_1338 [Ohtaekwangia koreensis]|uniref:Uncharacterized protein n=1 Tax=Ohtaekwangia koreensis TaxID=688867 RepID=A0A1T5JPR4_9BACT|nr:hypothetical protein SAMN05660236_1338 [Ohtaekwangia koreensis]